MLQSFYEEERGNLLQAWFAWRRVMTVAQAMGLHRDTETRVESLCEAEGVDARAVWNRLVYHDRYLSLMLGLPSALSELVGSSPQFGEPLDRLECIHAEVAAKIMRRNERNPNANDIAHIQKLPSSWWLPPNLLAARSEEQVF